MRKEHLVNYPMSIYPVEEEEGGVYWFAYHPDFGWSVCSATGGTLYEAIENLKLVKKDVINFFIEEGKNIPKPSNLSILE